ncbi:MAG: ABC transporter ATP-binding protein [SAR202 cluster bacterium]|nr:ABC transporter ATP-binding protein [SAR202 cluster bacterium]|tara:strand:- start:3465 stop:4508 length:1044 start_codon:yes stop_codon:yes gene_type:complete
MNNIVLLCDKLIKSFGETVALNQTKIELFNGEILAILGPSGCGKSTLLRAIAGFENIDSGDITINGKTVSSRDKFTPAEKRRVGMVFQDYALFPHLTVEDNVGFGTKSSSKSDKAALVKQMLKLVDLDGMEVRYPHELSGGQQQRVAVARTLAANPVTILLDEPFSNLDATMRTEIRNTVRHALQGRGVATIIVTHDREEAFTIADRVAVMNSGQIEQVDTPENMYRSPVSKFVANMTGTANFMPATITSNRAVTELGKFQWISPTNGIVEGDEVELLVRPDDFLVLPNPNASVTVTSREYRGDAMVLSVELGSGNTIQCRQGPYSDLPVGTSVDLVPSRSAPFVAF